MGACASVPKGMRAEAMAAPPPEQRKEEETTTSAPEVVEVTQDNDKHQSLGSLLNEVTLITIELIDEKYILKKTRSTNNKIGTC